MRLPSWRYRRRAITLSLALGAAGFLAGILALWARPESSVGIQLVVSSTVLVTTVTTAYVAGGVADDAVHRGIYQEIEPHE